jgi:hypothetical protein
MTPNDRIDHSSRRHVLHSSLAPRDAEGRAQWLYLVPKVPAPHAGSDCCRDLTDKERAGRPQWSKMAGKWPDRATDGECDVSGMGHARKSCSTQGGTSRRWSTIGSARPHSQQPRGGVDDGQSPASARGQRARQGLSARSARGRQYAGSGGLINLRDLGSSHPGTSGRPGARLSGYREWFDWSERRCRIGATVTDGP